MNKVLKAVALIGIFCAGAANALNSEAASNTKEKLSADLTVKSSLQKVNRNKSLARKRIGSESRRVTSKYKRPVTKRIRLTKSKHPVRIKKQQLSFKKGRSFKASLLSWCETAAAKCVWDAKRDFPFQADLTYEATKHLDIMEKLAKDLYLNKINLKIVYYKVNKIFRVIDDN